MSTLQVLTAEEFRRQLAGLEDVRGTAAFSTEAFREHATNFVVALALAFNRRALDATTLWTRIDSAIKRGVTAAQGGDVDALISSALSHVKASPNAVVSPEFAAMTDAIRALDEDAVYCFLRYLSDHAYTAIIAGKAAWETRKELRKALKAIETADAAGESEVTE